MDAVQNIRPHGGTLVDRMVRGQEATLLEQEVQSRHAITLDAVAEADLTMLGIGGYSPLDGFMGREQAAQVAESMRLGDGTLWSIPITLGIDRASADKVVPGSWVPLRRADDQTLLGALLLEEVFERDVQAEARAVFGTDDNAHPGVAQLLARGGLCAAGQVRVFEATLQGGHCADRRLQPRDSRALFVKNGWQRVVGFQTRNPVHRAHEYIIKCALESCDGLFLHPLVGYTKGDDIPADVRMRCYDALLESVFPKARVALSALPAPMRYAGPREAILHAIVRQNYGCTHFIVGRDHAGVGSYYGTYDAQKIFETLMPQDLAITIMAFEHAFYCKACGQMASQKTCPHGKDDHVFLSGTKVREKLRAGEGLPVEFSRPQVATILQDWIRGAAA